MSIFPSSKAGVENWAGDYRGESDLDVDDQFASAHRCAQLQASPPGNPRNGGGFPADVHSGIWDTKKPPGIVADFA